MHEKAQMLRDQLLERARMVGDVKVVQFHGELLPEMIRSMVPYFRGKFADVKFMFVAGTIHQGKPALTVFLSQPMVDEGYNASQIVREAAKAIQGGGGGQPFMATAGGKNADGLQEAIEKVIAAIH